MFDLNQPKDARAYVLVWVEAGKLRYEDPTILIKCTDEDFVKIAKVVFLQLDRRETPGGVH
jgi:hypothetical protein